MKQNKHKTKTNTKTYLGTSYTPYSLLPTYFHVCCVLFTFSSLLVI